MRGQGARIRTEVVGSREAGALDLSKVDGNMDTIPQDRSHLRGTSPSSYGTGPSLVDNLGPIPY